MANRTSSKRPAAKKKAVVIARPTVAEGEPVPQLNPGYAEITARIVAAVEAGTGQFKLPWNQDSCTSRPTNVLSGNHYNGINVLSLWEASHRCGYTSGTWGTFEQWKKLGCSVRKGERATRIIFVKQPTFADQTEDGELKLSKGRTVVRFHCVFNADQVNGYQAPAVPEPLDPVQKLERIDEFVRRTGAEIRHGGDRAFYNRSGDFIQMPPEASFVGTATSTPTESYYAVLLHELAHWFGAPGRRERPKGQSFGDDAYAMEELVAELASAFLCADLGVVQALRPDSAQYVGSWLKVLKEHSQAVFRAAAAASKAVDFLHLGAAAAEELKAA